MPATTRHQPNGYFKRRQSGGGFVRKSDHEEFDKLFLLCELEMATALENDEFLHDAIRYEFVADNLDDAILAVQAERDENTCRLELTVSEKVALGQRLEKLEKPKAKERQREAGKTHGKGQPKVNKKNIKLSTNANMTDAKADDRTRKRLLKKILSYPPTPTRPTPRLAIEPEYLTKKNSKVFTNANMTDAKVMAGKMSPNAALIKAGIRAAELRPKIHTKSLLASRKTVYGVDSSGEFRRIRANLKTIPRGKNRVFSKRIVGLGRLGKLCSVP